MSESRRLMVFSLAVGLVFGQSKTPTAAEAMQRNFDYINQKILTMAEDFPADKYDYKLKPEMRSFGAVIVHIASGNVYAAKAGKGESVKWTDEDPSKYTTKEQCVAFLKKSIDDANAALAMNPEGPQKNMQPFLSVLQHSSDITACWWRIIGQTTWCRPNPVVVNRMVCGLRRGEPREDRSFAVAAR